MEGDLNRSMQHLDSKYREEDVADEVQIEGDKALQKKLMSLGLRKGQEISVLHQRHHGVVVSSNGSRVALGPSVAAKIFLQPTHAQES